MLSPNIETLEQLSGSMFGDILGWMAAQVSEDAMKPKNEYSDFIFSLSDEDFAQLQEAVNLRINKQKYGVTTFEELALNVERTVKCPKCGSESYWKDGYTSAGHHRYRCKECGCSYTLLSNSIFNSTKLSFDDIAKYIVLMTFNVPLEMMMEICRISSNTAMLWRQKVFATVDGYQERLILKNRVWIDETYVFDSSLLRDNGWKRKRGLSRDLICIVVAIDCYKNIYAVICGHGKPSKSRIYKVLKDHIEPGAELVHDGDNSHTKLVDELHLKSEVYIADTKSTVYLEHMALINNLCSWLKRYLYRFIGMDMNNLQSYLNWFVYLFRVKAYDDRWPKIERILRHLALEETRFTRKY